MSTDYLDKILLKVDKKIQLDDEQKHVVLDDSNHLIVVAGAGTGKTLTITAKVKYLIDIKKIKAEEILIISLTNKAIGELRERINNKLEINVEICTFHKLAYNILKKNDVRYKIINNQYQVINDYIKNSKNTKKLIKILRKDKTFRRINDKYISNIELFVKKTIEVINLIKILDIDIKNIIIKNPIANKYREYLIEIIEYYNNVLKNNYELDFEDLIIKASKINDISIKYKYIIVDEYQDISVNRYKLLNNLVKITSAKTIVVGDDFQTIFSFAGSNIDLFLNYKNEMNAKVLKLTSTYRNSQQLIDVAGNLVMKNNNQINKKLKSNKSKEKPIKILGYKNSIDNIFEKTIKDIINIYGSTKSILVLGRYKNDILKINSREFIIKKNNILYIKNKNIKIDYMTIHASKGLGYDNVILINFNNDYLGFPSKIKEYNFLKEILKNDTTIEEERRLLYVAITRTKNDVYILTKIKNESEFMQDIYNDKNVYIDYKFKIIKSKSRHKIN